jgi:manganese/iron transport system permease protein
MFEVLLDPFQYSFMIRALLVSILVGIMSPIIGSYVITRGLAFMGDALAHAVMPGLIIAFLLGVSPFAGAAPTGVAVAILIGVLTRRTGISEDTTIGIMFAGLFAVGLVLLSLSTNLPINLEDLLLGQVLGVSWLDVYLTLGLCAFVVFLLSVFHKELVFSSFDPLGAKVSGLPTMLLDYLLLVLLALVVIIALQAVGIVLVMAMLVTPSATAYLLVRRLPSVMAVGATLGACSAISGLYLSYYFDIPSGAAMTLVATTSFVVVAIFRKRVV